MQVFRLARAGQIPGARTTKGGHRFFVRCPALGEWIARRRAFQALRPLKRWKGVLKDARQADGPVPKSAIKDCADLIHWLAKGRPEFWTRRRRAAWRKNLEPIVKFCGRL